MEYPKVSILTPTYNRHKFIPLMIDNISRIEYDKTLLEWCILDDGTTPLFDKKSLEYYTKLIKPIKLKYTYEKKKKV